MVTHEGLCRALTLLIAAAVGLVGCVPLAAPVKSTVTPLAGSASSLATRSGDGSGLVIYAPATPSSVPVLLAAQRMGQDAANGGDIRVVIYNNQTQASSLFLRGDVPLLVTGLSVGVEFFRNGAPAQAVNSYVAGLTYLVTYGKPIASLKELQGGQVYIPFQGSPIEETTQYFAEQEGLAWGRDIKPVYAPFVSSVELLKQGKAAAVALPEPFVSLVEKQPGVFISLSYRDRWDVLTGSTVGYPQVATFAQANWAAAHPDVIARFNAELAAAIEEIGQDPAAAVAQTAGALGLSSGTLQSALARTSFAFTSGDAMAQAIRRYYQTVGKPLDETYDAFFYNGTQ